MTNNAGPLYPKINTAFKRDADNHMVILPNEYAQPEFVYLENNTWGWTEKLDGMNMRIHWDGEGFGFGGRTDKARIPEQLANHILGLIERWEDEKPEIFCTGLPVTLYGEGIGAGIQKGAGYDSRQIFVLFDLRVGNIYLEPQRLSEAAHDLSVPTVVPAFYLSLREMVKCMWDAALDNAPVTSQLYPAHELEGYVGIPWGGLLDRRGNRIQTKLKQKDFRDLVLHSGDGPC